MNEPNEVQHSHIDIILMIMSVTVLLGWLGFVVMDLEDQVGELKLQVIELEEKHE